MEDVREIIKKGDKGYTLSGIAKTADGAGHRTAREQLQSALLVQCTEDLEGAISKISTSLSEAALASENLSKQMLALNIILGFLTAIGVYFTVQSFLGRPIPTAVWG